MAVRKLEYLDLYNSSRNQELVAGNKYPLGLEAEVLAETYSSSF